MKKASVAELKSRLSEFLAAVKRGEDVIVTERGRPVARLTGLAGGAGLDARMSELVRAGLVKPPQRRLPRDFLRQAAPADPEGKLLEAVRSDREEGW